MHEPASLRTRHARALFASIAAGYDRWAALLSFGQDPRWRRFLVSRLDVSADAVVADVATGTGAVAIETARRFGCTVVGIDQSPEMLARGRERVAAAGLASRVDLRWGRAEALPLETASVDALTHTYLLRYVDDPGATLRELARPLRPGGTMAALEFGVPAGAAYPAWWAWTRIGLPAAGAAAGDGWYATGRFLGGSIESFWRSLPLPELISLWRDAGLSGIRARRMSLGGAVVVWGRKAG
jgi:demethylmenaquinone methyltransferase / 2-methoxy-6-polyprenyl-1,4-benzoquinol methylase